MLKKFRGCCYQGQDLTDADFSYADLRGVNFSEAVLLRANFSHSKAGLQPFQVFILLVGSLLLASLASFISAYAGGLVGSVLVREKVFGIYAFTSIITILVAIAAATVIICEGIGAKLGLLAVTVGIVAAVILASADAEDKIVPAIVVQILALALAGTGVVVGAIASATLTIALQKKSMLFLGFTCLTFAIFGIRVGLHGNIYGSRILAWIVASALALTLLLLSVYISWTALTEKGKCIWIRNIAVSYTSIGGTNFRGADLTEADFTSASLKNADFRRAILTRTCWYQSFDLEKSHLQGTLLENPQVRQLAVKKYTSADANFDRVNLRDLNLESASLQGSSFIGADLNGSNLSNANLRGAKLVRAQLYQANLMGACLTGAYIQDWGISAETKFNNVRCEFVYMRLPTRNDPDPCRKPDNKQEKFQGGDFVDFITPIIKTLDLYQSQNVDPRKMAGKFKNLDFFHHEEPDPSAVAVALRQLAEQNPEAEIEVVALEGRGNKKIRVQAQVADRADRSKLSAEYFEKYQKLSNLPYGDLQALLASMEEKSERIRSLENMLIAAIKSNKFYVETHYNMGDTVSEKSSIHIQVDGDIGNISGIVGGNVSGILNLDTINGDVANTISQLLEQSDSKQLKLKELLTRLHVLIETEEQLPVEDKAEALEQVKTLAEAGRKSEDSDLHKAAKTAIKILKGTVFNLSETAILVSEGTSLLEAIAALLLEL